MLRLIFSIILLVWSCQAMAFDKGKIEYVQQSLVELGFDPGPIDGAWGGKTRRALNSLRSKHNLPEVNELVGSSIELIHRVRPTDQTLPRPGQLQTDAAARRAYLVANPKIAETHCGNGWGLPTLSVQPSPVTKLTQSLTPDGKISASDDWFSEIGTRFAVTAAACQAGDNQSCFKVVDGTYQWAKSNALQTSLSKSSKKFDEVQWIAGSILRPVLSSYATARQLVDVPNAQDALIVDWLVDRAARYYLPERRTPGTFKNQDLATNHQVSSALLYAMAGALIGDKPMFEEGLRKWEEAITSMREDGSFPTETQRGAWSLSYTGLQLNYMVGLAELARHQGYALEDRTEGLPDISDAAEFQVRAMADYDIVKGYAAKNVGSGDDNPGMPVTTAFDEMFGWMPYLFSTNRDAEFLGRMANLELDKKICSAQQIKEGKATKWKCAENANIEGPLMLAQMLDAAMLGHFNAGHIGACTHADRVDYFDANANVIKFLQSDWPSDLEKPKWKPAKPIKTVFETEVLLNHSPNNEQRFNILFESTKVDGISKGSKFKFNLNGRETFSGHPDVSSLKIVLNRSVSKKVAQELDLCGSNVKVEEWDGNRMPSITALRESQGEVYNFKNAECMLRVLPSNYRMDVKTLFSEFEFLIGDFVRSGNAKSLKNKLLEKWMDAINSGDRSVNF